MNKKTIFLACCLLTSGMSHGMLPALRSMSARIRPAAMRLVSHNAMVEEEKKSLDQWRAESRAREWDECLHEKREQELRDKAFVKERLKHCLRISHAQSVVRFLTETDHAHDRIVRAVAILEDPILREAFIRGNNNLFEAILDEKLKRDA